MIVSQKEKYVSEKIKAEREKYERNLKIKKILLEWWLDPLFYYVYIFRAKHLGVNPTRAVTPCWRLQTYFKDNFSEKVKPELLIKYRKEYDELKQKEEKVQ